MKNKITPELQRKEASNVNVNNLPASVDWLVFDMITVLRAAVRRWI
jgi:hypothetical protein